MQSLVDSYQFTLMQKVEMSLLGMMGRGRRKGIVMLTVVEPDMDESHRWAMVFLLIPHLRSETCDHYVGPVPQEETQSVLRLVEVHNSETSVDNHVHMQVVFLPVEVVGEMMWTTAVLRLLKTADPPVNRGWVRQMMDRMFTPV